MKSSMFNFQLQREDTIFTYRLYIHIYTFVNYSFVKHSCSSKLLYVKYFKCMATKNYKIPVFHIHLTFVGIFLVDLSKSSSHTTSLQLTADILYSIVSTVDLRQINLDYLTYFPTHLCKYLIVTSFKVSQDIYVCFAIFCLLYTF